MSLLRCYNNKEPREESLAEVYYSSTFEVTSYMKHSIGCGVEPRIKIQRVSHNSQPSSCESFIIRYGEVLYTIIEIGIDNTRYESSEVYLFDEPTNIEDFSKFYDLDIENYEYNEKSIPYWTINIIMDDNQNIVDLHYSDFFSY